MVNFKSFVDVEVCIKCIEWKRRLLGIVIFMKLIFKNYFFLLGIG